MLNGVYIVRLFVVHFASVQSFSLQKFHIRRLTNVSFDRRPSDLCCRTQIPAMTKCCNQLDTCYDTCGSNKYRCDSKFRWCLHSICSDLKKSLGFVSKVEGWFRFF